MVDCAKESGDLREAIAGMRVDIENLKEWQKNQNGTIHTVDKKIDGLKNWIMILMGGIVTSIFVSFLKG